MAAEIGQVAPDFTVPSHTGEQGWFPTLSDFWPHGEVARTYGAFNEEKGCADRVTVVIDRGGTVVDRFASDGPSPLLPFWV